MPRRQTRFTAEFPGIYDMAAVRFSPTSLALEAGEPEGWRELVAEFVLEPHDVHALSTRLDRVEDIDSHLDQRGDQGIEGAIGVQHDLHLSVLMHPVQSTAVERHHTFAEHLDGQKGRLLGAEVIADLQDLHAVAHRLDEAT